MPDFLVGAIGFEPTTPTVSRADGGVARRGGALRTKGKTRTWRYPGDPAVSLRHRPSGTPSGTPRRSNPGSTTVGSCRQEARRVLRNRAQRAGPPRRVRRPDPGRDVLRSRCSGSRRTRRPATRGAKAARGAEPSRSLRCVAARCSSAERAHRRMKITSLSPGKWSRTHLGRSSYRMLNAGAGLRDAGDWDVLT